MYILHTPYIDCGKQDEFGFAEMAHYFSLQLRRHGVEHHFELVDGRHDEALWQQRSVVGLQFLIAHFERYDGN